MSIFKGSNYVPPTTGHFGGFHGNFTHGYVGKGWETARNAEHASHVKQKNGMPKYKSTCKSCGGKM
jgi:hypothetical protein